MARQLPFHMLTSPITRGCPWWILLWSYIGANWTSKLGDTCPEQGCLDMSISAVLRRMLTQKHQCSQPTSWVGMLGQKHQCSQHNSLEQGCPEQRHQCSISIGLLILFNCNWMVPDVVPSKTIHYRFLILRSPGSLIRHLLSKCYKDKGTWRQETIVHIIDTGVTVFEVN